MRITLTIEQEYIIEPEDFDLLEDDIIEAVDAHDFEWLFDNDVISMATEYGTPTFIDVEILG